VPTKTASKGAGLPARDGNKRREQSEETRRLLLEVSLDLFVHKGYAGTKVRDIARQAGVSPGLMFHYFPSKQALLEEHIRVVAGGLDAVSQRLVGAKNPLETFTGIARETLDSFKQDYAKNLFLLANQVLSFDSSPRSARKAVSSSKSFDASVALILMGQRKRVIRAGDPMALAVGFWGALQGIAEVLVWRPEAGIPGAEMIVAILKA